MVIMVKNILKIISETCKTTVTTVVLRKIVKLQLQTVVLMIFLKLLKLQSLYILKKKPMWMFTWIQKISFTNI